MNVNGVANADAKERSGHFAIECPVAECRRFGEPAFLLNSEQIEPDGLWISFTDRRWKVGGLTRNVGFDQRLRRKYGRHQKLTLHTRQSVTGNAAEIEEVAGFRRTENNRRAGALAIHPWRFRVLIGKHDVMFGALSIDQGELHDLSFGRGQNRIGLAVDQAANSQKNHFSFRDSGAQRVLRIREISRLAAWFGLRRCPRRSG